MQCSRAYVNIYYVKAIVDRLYVMFVIVYHIINHIVESQIIVYVMTVGDSLPVNFSSCTRPMARSAKLFSAEGAASPYLSLSFSYFSRYIRMVAPADPVPLRRKTTRASSPLAYWKNKIRPWLDVRDPSTGSV